MAAISYKLADGTVVQIETTEAHRAQSGLLASGAAAATERGEALSFDEQTDGVTKMASALLRKFREDAGEEPSEVRVSFGLKASAETGAIVVAKAGVEASINVSLSWNKRSAEAEKAKE